MKRNILIGLLLLISINFFGQSFQRSGSAFLRIGSSFLSTAPAVVDTTFGGQIIADHTVVDKYSEIPQRWIDTVKTMWLTMPGESHSEAYRVGLSNLATAEPKYAANVTLTGTPEAKTATHLRASRATWGDINNPSGWIYDYGEEDWCCLINYPTYTFNQTAVDRTKAGIKYAYDNNLEIGAMGFAQCYDDGRNLAYSYIRATKEYMAYCASQGYKTKMFFTTGPIDDYMASGADGWEQYNKWKIIRDSVAVNPTWPLFDYADILSHDNNGTETTTTYDSHTFPVITPTNQGTQGIGHIDAIGALRLAKAMWWMLARLSGWDGNPNEAEVNNMISNGSFSSVTGWIIQGTTPTTNIADGVLHYTNEYGRDVDQEHGAMITPFKSSTNYKMTFTTANNSSTGVLIEVWLEDSYSKLVNEAAYPNGSHEVTFTTPAEIGTYSGLRLIFNGGGSADIDNIVLTEVL